MSVIILGAGPAGLTVAHALQRQGIAVLVADPDGPGGSLNIDYDFVPQSGEVRRSLSVKEDLLRPWEVAAIPLIREQAQSAQWDSKSKSWTVMLGRDKRSCSWLVSATGVASRTGGYQPSFRMHVRPDRSVYDLDVRGQRLAVLGGGDNAFEYASLALKQHASVKIFARSVRAQSKFVEAIDPNDVAGVARDVEERADGIWVDGERFDHAFIFYGFEAKAPAVMIDGETVKTSSDGRYQMANSQTQDVQWSVIGDVRLDSVWTIEHALNSANAAAARIALAFNDLSRIRSSF